MRLWVDFNEVEDHEFIEADLEFAQFFMEKELQQGKRADLFDGAGHQCQAVVSNVDRDNGLLDLRIDWGTWESPRRPHVFESKPALSALNVTSSSRTQPRAVVSTDWKWDWSAPVQI